MPRFHLAQKKEHNTIWTLRPMSKQGRYMALGEPEMLDMNILLIVCDTLRADHLGCYGYFRETSPNIDKIASEGIIVKDFYNAGCPTGPGFTSIITGLQAIHHKYYKFGFRC